MSASALVASAVEPSPDAIADAIVSMVTDDNLRQRLQAGARAHARLLSWDRCGALTYGLAQPAQYPATDSKHASTLEI